MPDFFLGKFRLRRSRISRAIRWPIKIFGTGIFKSTHVAITAKITFLDPRPPLVRETCIGKTYPYDDRNQQFCIKLFSASSETLFNINGTNIDAKKIEVLQKHEKTQFLTKIGVQKIEIIRSPLEVEPKSLIFWI